MQPAADPTPSGSPRAVVLAAALAAVLAVTAMAGAGVLATRSIAGVPRIPHGAVHLTADATLGWSDVLDTAGQNLAAVQREFSAEPFAVLTQIGANLRDYAQLIIGMKDVPLNLVDVSTGADSEVKTITSGFAGVAQGWQQALNGFPDHPDIPGLLQLPQTLAADLHGGDPLQAFSDIDTWFLFSLEGLLKPLVPVVTIPEAMVQNLTSVLTETVGPQSLWDFGKAVDKAFSEPLLGVGFEWSTILGEVQAGTAGTADGDAQGALATLATGPARLADALLNGYQVPGSDNSFIGLLSTGGTLESLLVTWPQRIAAALAVGTADLHDLTPAGVPVDF